MLERRGVGFIALSFLLCPCHLPLTLGLLGSLIGGTALGAVLHAHPYLAGTLITLVWGTGTWFGVQQLRRAARYATGLRRALSTPPNETAPR